MLQKYFVTLLSHCLRSVVQFKHYCAGLFFRKEPNQCVNLQCYMSIHPPGADSLCSLPSLFPTCTPLCGRSPTESEEKYLSDKLIPQPANIFIYYLPIILKLQQLPPPSAQPTGKCLTYIKHQSFKSKVFDGYTKTTIQEPGINYKHQ